MDTYQQYEVMKIRIENYIDYEEFDKNECNNIKEEVIKIFINVNKAIHYNLLTCKVKKLCELSYNPKRCKNIYIGRFLVENILNELFSEQIIFKNGNYIGLTRQYREKLAKEKNKTKN